MKADAYTVGELFDIPIQYRVPLYQRPYVWERDVEDPSEDRLTPFWEDVRDTVSRYVARQEHISGGVPEDELATFTDHFFGAVVLGQLDKSFSGIPYQQDQIRDFIEEFITDAKLYRSFDSLPEGTTPRRFFDRLGLLDTTTLYPVALRLFAAERDGELTAVERDEALRALESWVVRRMVCDFTSKNYNRTAVELLKAIEASVDRPHAAVVDFLRNGTVDTEVWPRDESVLSALTDRPLYNRIKPVRRVRLLLEACELERRLEGNGFTEMKEQEAPQLDLNLTIEHILPQSWQEHWSVGSLMSHLPAWENTGSLEMDLQTRREAHVHLLGNLTLVTKKLNPSVGRSSWTTKRKALDDHSILQLNRDLVRNYEEDWNEEGIDERGRQLATLISRHWPGPN